MRGTVERILEEIVFQNQERLLRGDTDYIFLQKEVEQIRKKIRNEYGDDKTLDLMVNDLEDAYISIKEYENHFRLLLGLQVGLEF